MNNDFVVILLITSVLFLIFFFDGFVTLFVILPYFSFVPNSLIFSPACTVTSVDSDDCYDASKTSGGAILNCLHGGVCPKGVSYQADEESNTSVSVVVPSSTTVDVIMAVADDDSDGVNNNLDECVNIPETINGFKDFDGCPESYPNSAPITQYVQPDLYSVLTNPPDLSYDIFQPYSDIPQTEQKVNLNEYVSNAVVITILLILVLVISILIISRKRINKLL